MLNQCILTNVSNNLRANLFRLAKKETNMSDIIKKFANLWVSLQQTYPSYTSKQEKTN